MKFWIVIFCLFLTLRAGEMPSVFLKPAREAEPFSLLPRPALNVAGHDCNDHAECEDGEVVAATLSVPKRNQELLALSFATAEARAVRDTLRIAGCFEWMPDAMTVYAAPVAGRVAMKVRPPQNVEAGDALFTVESPDWLRELALLEVDAKAAETKAGLLGARVEALKAAGRRDAGLEMELAEALAESERVKVELEWKKKAGGIGLRPVTSPDRPEACPTFAQSRGKVMALATTNGAWLDAGGEVLTLADPAKVWFRAEANTREAAVLKEGQQAFVETPDGEIEVALEIGFPDPQTPRVTPLFGVVQNPPEWARPGRAGRLRVVTKESAPRGVAVPDACIAQDGVKAYVIVRDAKDALKFHKREVTPGASDDVWTEVGGLRTGEVVVKEGVYELNLAMPVDGAKNRAPAGHFHADGRFHEGSH